MASGADSDEHRGNLLRADKVTAVAGVNTELYWGNFKDYTPLEIDGKQKLAQSKCVFALKFNADPNSPASGHIDLADVSALVIKTHPLKGSTGRLSFTAILVGDDTCWQQSCGYNLFDREFIIPVCMFTELSASEKPQLSDDDIAALRREIDLPFLKPSVPVNPENGDKAVPAPAKIHARALILKIDDAPEKLQRIVFDKLLLHRCDKLLKLNRRSDSDYVLPRKGAAINCQLNCEKFTLTTSLGRFVIPASKVLGGRMLDASNATLALTDGQIVSGHLGEKSIETVLTINEKARMKFRDISSFAYKLSKEKTLLRPAQSPWLLSDSNRLHFSLAEGQTIVLQTPHGDMALPLDAIAAMSPAASQQWRLKLINGSDVRGRLVGDTLDISFSISDDDERQLHMPISAIDHITGTASTPPAARQLEMRLKNTGIICGAALADSIMVKSSSGSYALDTDDILFMEFDPTDINMAKITLWDAREVYARVLDETIAIDLGINNQQIRPLTAHITSVDFSKACDGEKFTRRIAALAKLTCQTDSTRSATAHKALLRIGPAVTDIIEAELPAADTQGKDILKRILKHYHQPSAAIQLP